MTGGRTLRTAAILATGEELVRGAVVDRNGAFLARRLRALGLRVGEARVVGDEVASIAAAVRELCARADVVLVSGGLGPTPDDRTREAIAAAAGVALVDDAEARAQIEAWFAGMGRPMAASNARQALLPAGARAVRNPLGSAPGVAFELGRALLFALPGVPRELHAMFEREVEPRLRALAAEAPLREVLLQVAGLPESVVGERIAAAMAAEGPPWVSDTVDHGLVTICVADRDDAAGRARQEACAASIEQALGDHVYARGPARLPEWLVATLGARGATLATAESCTGGELAAAVTAVPGSSAVFVEGAVSYAAPAKVRLLGVPAELIEREGVVSEAVARAMAEGVRARSGADYGVATTGIAGPGGGSAARPVGWVHVAVAGPGGTVHRGRRFPGERADVQRFAVIAALDLLRRSLA